MCPHTILLVRSNKCALILLCLSDVTNVPSYYFACLKQQMCPHIILLVRSNKCALILFCLSDVTNVLSYYFACPKQQMCPHIILLVRCNKCALILFCLSEATNVPLILQMRYTVSLPAVPQGWTPNFFFFVRLQAAKVSLSPRYFHKSLFIAILLQGPTVGPLTTDFEL